MFTLREHVKVHANKNLSSGSTRESRVVRLQHNSLHHHYSDSILICHTDSPVLSLKTKMLPVDPQGSQKLAVKM